MSMAMTTEQQRDALLEALRKINGASMAAVGFRDLQRVAYDAISAIESAKAREVKQEPTHVIVEFPPMPCGIVKHEKLGELYDRLQMQMYALKYADKLYTRPVPLREMSVDELAKIIREVDGKHELGAGALAEAILAAAKEKQ